MSQKERATLAVSAVAVTVSLFISAGVLATESNDEADRYQSSESVSGTVYHSQSGTIEVKRNVELVKPRSETLVLSESVSRVAITQPQMAATDSVASVTNVVEPKVTDEPEEPENDVSMLSFIDEWLGIKPVKPWQKGKLAKQEMKPGGVVPEFDAFSEKVFSYKQGSVGGSGVGGGGCGCN